MTSRVQLCLHQVHFEADEGHILFTPLHHLRANNTIPVTGQLHCPTYDVTAIIHSLKNLLIAFNVRADTSVIHNNSVGEL